MRPNRILVVTPGKLVRWDDVPSLSEDFARADDAIRKRVVDLIEELILGFHPAKTNESR